TPFNYGDLGDDIASLIAYAQRRPEVNGQQVALVGHSMGAYAVYAYALQHPEVDAVVPISGSALGGTELLPHKVVLIDASGDAERTRVNSRAAMRRLTGRSDGIPDETHGTLRDGTARRFVEVPGNDHVSILFSEVPLREMVEWLRGTWGLPAAPYQPASAGMARTGMIAVISGLLVFFPLAGFLSVALRCT